MKTNVGIETTDEERKRIAASLGYNGLASKKDINAAVQNYIRDLIERNEYIVEEDYALSREARGARHDDDQSEEVESPAESSSVGSDQDDTAAGGDQGISRDDTVRKFVPSRGDEPYLYEPEDLELAAVCSNVLDGLEYIERYTWDALERNRK